MTDGQKKNILKAFHLLGMFFKVAKRDGLFVSAKRARETFTREMTTVSHGANKKTSETCEFFVPDIKLKLKNYIQTENIQAIHHLGRYEWAVRVIENIPHKKILDIACGSGFGSHMIASHFSSSDVIGVDYDQRAVDMAKNRYDLTNLKYAKGNIVTWKFEDGCLGKFDVIVSFDTIEHLLHREIALKNIVNNLSDSGLLLISTPCGHSESLLNPGWEHHKIEYSNSDLYDLLKRYFKNVYRADDDNLPALDYWKDVINKDRIRYDNRMNPLVCSGPILIRNDGR